MAIANQTELEKTEPCFLRATDQCFYCGSQLSGNEWIFWNGNDEKGQQIWMHPDCAKRLSDHLNKDYANTRRTA